MLPVLNAIVQRLTDGPNHTYVNSDNITWTPPPLVAMFTNDGQINQLVSEIGVFDEQEPLPPTYIPEDQVSCFTGEFISVVVDYHQLYVAANYVSMRGTISFERLTCGGHETFIRIQLNDAVYRTWNHLQDEDPVD